MTSISKMRIPPSKKKDLPPRHPFLSNHRLVCSQVLDARAAIVGVIRAGEFGSKAKIPRFEGTTELSKLTKTSDLGGSRLRAQEKPEYPHQVQRTR